MKHSHGRRRTYEARVRDMKARYRSKELQGHALKTAVSHCFYLQEISLFDTAKVLNRSVSDIECILFRKGETHETHI